MRWAAPCNGLSRHTLHQRAGRGDGRSAMQDFDYYVIFNERAGTASAQGVTADALRGMFEDAGLRCHIDARSDISLGQRVADAVASPAEILVAAGGDGTITALAEAL